MKMKCNLYITKGGTVRITKGDGVTRAGEVRIELSLDVPDVLFKTPAITASVVIPEPPASPGATVAVHEALRIAQSIQADARQIVEAVE